MLDASEVRFGSFSTKLGYPGDVRFSLGSDRRADIAVGPVRGRFCCKSRLHPMGAGQPSR
jgi:hypothetical protein